MTCVDAEPWTHDAPTQQEGWSNRDGTESWFCRACGRELVFQNFGLMKSFRGYYPGKRLPRWDDAERAAKLARGRGETPAARAAREAAWDRVWAIYARAGRSKP